MKLISAAVKPFSPMSVETALIDAPLTNARIGAELTARGLTLAHLTYCFSRI